MGNEELVSLMKRQLRVQKIHMILTAIILAVLAVSAVVIVPKTVNTITKVDKSLDTLNSTVLPAVSKLDMAELNGTVSDLKTAINGIDIDSLNDAIKNLDVTLKPLAQFMEKFGS
ncbi:MAG TPA: hypothetical protein PLN48_00700 [Lachnospiraceae bacterium]|nr:hypothetical protein [Lachnospiraceae bacterium]